MGSTTTTPTVNSNNLKRGPIPVVPITMKIVNPDGTPTRSGQLLLEQLQQVQQGTGGGGGELASETPSGPLNGSNTTFTLSSAATLPMILVLNGVIQEEGVDYTVTGSTITYAVAPKSNDWQTAFYTAGGSGGSSGGGGGGGGGGAVSSVFGRTGAVVAVSGDYSASEVTNAVDQTATYANPAWISSLAYSKITGAPAAAVSSVFGRTGAVVAASGDYTVSQVTGALADPTTTKADLLVRGSSAVTRLGVGSDGQVLTADSTQTLGVKWAAGGNGGGTTVTAAPPYISVGGSLYLASTMYAVTLPAITGWSILASATATLGASANGAAQFDAPGSTQVWAYSGSLAAFTKLDVVNQHSQYLVNNGSAGDWLGVYVWDSANNIVWSFTQHTGYWDQIDVANWSWSGSTSTVPSGAGYYWVMEGLHYSGTAPGGLVFRTVNNTPAKTITFSISLDGGLTFKTCFTTAAQTNTPVFGGILFTACAGTLAVYSMKTS